MEKRDLFICMFACMYGFKSLIPIYLLPWWFFFILKLFMKLCNMVNQTNGSLPRESSVGPTNCIFVSVCIHTSQSCSENTVRAWAHQDHVRATFSNQSTWLDEKEELTPLPKPGLAVIGTGAGTSTSRTSYRDLPQTLWRNPTLHVSLNSDRSRAHRSMASSGTSERWTKTRSWEMSIEKKSWSADTYCSKASCRGSVRASTQHLLRRWVTGQRRKEAFDEMVDEVVCCLFP